MTSKQIIEQRIQSMGQELGRIYDAVTNDVSWLHAKWNEYRKLFAHSPERITRLNEIGGYFFRIVQDVLFENVVLHIARLTDPSRSLGKAGKDNLSLLRLSEAITDPALAADVQDLVNTALGACQSMRDRRHRTLAHTDLALALATASDPLSGISRADVESALKAIRNVMHRLEKHYLNSETAYEHVLAPSGDVESVVHYLGIGLEAEEAAKQQE